jgi:heterodisulfide reductase subunit C
MDPRKAVRMAVLGLDDELIESRWPWVCTLCGRCENACPMGVEIVAMTRKARSCASATWCRAPCTRECHDGLGAGQ